MNSNGVGIREGRLTQTVPISRPLNISDEEGAGDRRMELEE